MPSLPKTMSAEGHLSEPTQRADLETGWTHVLNYKHIFLFAAKCRE